MAGKYKGFLYALIMIIAFLIVFTCSKSTEPENQRPNKPGNMLAEASGLGYKLMWNCLDQDNDSLTFDIYFGTCPTPLLVSSGQIDTFYVTRSLEYSTLYCWLVIAKDIHGATTTSDTSSFESAGEPPKCSVSTTSLNYNNVYINNSEDISFTISNIGGDTLTGSVSEDCDFYSIVSGEGSYALTSDQSHEVTIKYSPTTSGTNTCTIETGVDGCPDVGCTGVAEPSPCSVFPITLDFGTICEGGTKDLPFTIANNSGTENITGAVSISCPEYSIVSGGDSYDLNPGHSKTVTVRYSPVSTGTKTCTIETGTACSNVSCTGIGEPSPCSVSPASLDFSNVYVGGTKDMTFTIKNDGGTCNLTGTISESCSDYAIISGGGYYDISPDDSSTITVRFSPVSTGTKTCTIETGNACSNISCTGVGEPSSCSVSPAYRDFGTVNIGDIEGQLFIITNAGDATLTGTVSESCDHYSIISGGGSYSLEKDQTHEVTFQFSPTSVGTKTCTIQIGSFCPDINCTGIGAEAP